MLVNGLVKYALYAVKGHQYNKYFAEGGEGGSALPFWRGGEDNIVPSRSFSPIFMRSVVIFD